MQWRSGHGWCKNVRDVVCSVAVRRKYANLRNLM
jgi:hypothetical protein